MPRVRLDSLDGLLSLRRIPGRCDPAVSVVQRPLVSPAPGARSIDGRYALSLVVFIFFARFMNDSYVGLTLVLTATVPALNGHPISGPAHAISNHMNAVAA